MNAVHYDVLNLGISLPIVQILLTVTMLGVASYWDMKKREIPDLLWLVFGGISVIFPLLSSDIVSAFTAMGISMIVAPIALVIWRIGFFGGADAFALIAIAALSPMASISGIDVNPFTTLTNGIILSGIPIVVNIIRNLIALCCHKNIFLGFEHERQRNKILAMFVGYRAQNPKFGFAIEKTVGRTRKLDFSLKNADSTDFCTSKDTWITPGIPYLIYITAGFVVQILYGDIIFRILQSV